MSCPGKSVAQCPCCALASAINESTAETRLWAGVQDGQGRRGLPPPSWGVGLGKGSPEVKNWGVYLGFTK